MTVLSKEVKVISIFDSIPYTCYEVGHCWEPHCFKAFTDTFRDSFKFSLKVYLIFYAATTLVKLRKKKYRNAKEVGKFCRSVLQSSLFLAANGTLFIGSFCVVRHIFGKFYGWHGFLCGFITGYLSMLLERKSRRSALALYILNLACATLFNMAVSRKLITPVRNGEVLIFSIASAGLMSLYRNPDSLSQALKGPLDFMAAGKAESVEQSIASLQGNPLIRMLEEATPKHATCKHSEGCAFYVAQGFLRQFAVGYLIEFGLNLIQLIRGRAPKNKLTWLLKSTSLASFFGFYAFLFRGLNCALRWIFGKDQPSVYGAVSGFVAGLSSWFYKSSTISVYVLFKFLEEIAMKKVESGSLPYISNANVYIYAAGLGVMLHAACVEPHNIRPGYWTFLSNVSGRKFPGMFRQLLDIYGTKASSKYPNYVPPLHAKYVKSVDVIKLLVTNGKWEASAF